MKSGKLFFGFARTLSFGLVCLCVTSQARAQENAAPTEEPAKPEDQVAAPEAPAKVPDKTPEPAPKQPPPPPAGSVEATERDKAVNTVEVERLPGSAYPEPYVRGLKGGSLWLTFHGLQWPYMPALDGKSKLILGFSGSLWNDLSYSRINSGLPTKQESRKRWASQGRGVLRVTPTYSTPDGWFAQGQAEFVANGDTNIINNSLASTDDLYVRFGKWNLFDITVGRYQGWELMHYGMGLDLNTLERQGATIEGLTSPPPFYGLSYFWDRQDIRMGNYAAHLYFTKFLRAEILGQFGAGIGGNFHQANFRPIGVFDIGWLKLKAGWEYGKGIPQADKGEDRNTKNGFGFAAQFVVNPYIEGGASFAKGYEDIINTMGVPDQAASNTTTGIGGFLNGRIYGPLILGLGAYQFHWEDLRPDGNPGPNHGVVDSQDNFLCFAALQYSFWDTIYFKFVASHANQHFHNYSLPDFSNNSWGGRFRAMVLF